MNFSHPIKTIFPHILPKDPEKKMLMSNRFFFKLQGRFRINQGTSHGLPNFIKLREICSKISYDHVTRFDRQSGSYIKGD